MMKFEEINNNKVRTVFPYKGTPFMLYDNGISDKIISENMPCIIFNLGGCQDLSYYTNHLLAERSSNIRYIEYEHFCKMLEYKEEFESLIK